MMNYANKQPYPSTGSNGIVVSGRGPNSPCYPQPMMGLDMASVKTWLDAKNTVVPVTNKYLVGGAALALVLGYFAMKKSGGGYGRDYDFDF
jgi:hypothetical protein